MSQRLVLLTVFLTYGLFCTGTAGAAEKTGDMEVIVAPDHADHLYTLGDSAVFQVEIKAKNGQNDGINLRYRFSEDGESTLEEGVRNVPGNKLRLAQRLARPGFLRLNLTVFSGSDTTRAVAAAGFDPQAIRPTNRLPDDFDRFWRNARAELMRIDMDARIEALPDSAGPGVKNYLVSLANIGGARVFGRLALPEGEGPFPAVLVVPGAGVGVIRPGGDYVRAGFVTLAIDVHGIPQDREDAYYLDLSDGVLAAYHYFGCDDPYQFYYRRVILGCMRALDYLASREDVDSTRLAIAGSSQGGALSLLTAGLDPRIKALTANVPAMCDHTGSLHGRPSGWPRLLGMDGRECVRRTSAYYDAALNAGLITVPARLAVGFVDGVCAPTSVYAAYNNLKGPKEINHFPEMGHSYGKGWQAEAVRWLRQRLDESKLSQGAKVR